MKAAQEERIIALLQEELNPAEAAALHREIQKDSDLKQLYLSYREMLELMDQAPEREPPEALRQQFHRDLQHHSSDASVTDNALLTLRQNTWIPVAAIALIVIGVAFGALYMRNQNQQRQIETLSQQVKQTQRMLALSMLEVPSASERIKAVQKITSQQSADPDIVQALLQRLNTDNNVNVRMRAAEALQQYPAYPGLKEALIKSLQQQENPAVQITLIDVLVELRATQAVSPLQEMLQQDSLIEVVRDHAAYGLQRLI